MKEEEIDLTQIYKSLKQSNVYKKLVLLLNFVWSTKFWFILFLISGISIGYFIKSSSAPAYKSEMIIKSKYLNNYSSFELINSLNTLIIDKNRVELNKIEFSNELVKSINKIEFVYPDEITDSLKKQEPFKVIVESNQNNLLPAIGDAIYNYLSNNPASISNENKSKSALTKEIAELKTKLVDLDSLQALIVDYFYSNRIVLKGQPMIVDPASVLRERRETFSEIVRMEKELNDIGNYIIIQKMTSKFIPEKKSNKPIVICSLLFLLFGGLSLFLFRRPTNKAN